MNHIGYRHSSNGLLGYKHFMITNARTNKIEVIELPKYISSYIILKRVNAFDLFWMFDISNFYFINPLCKSSQVLARSESTHEAIGMHSNSTRGFIGVYSSCLLEYGFLSIQGGDG